MQLMSSSMGVFSVQQYFEKRSKASGSLNDSKFNMKFLEGHLDDL